jgi:hypothetical protein
MRDPSHLQVLPRDGRNCGVSTKRANAISYNKASKVESTSKRKACEAEEAYTKSQNNEEPKDDYMPPT